MIFFIPFLFSFSAAGALQSRTTPMDTKASSRHQKGTNVFLAKAPHFLPNCKSYETIQPAASASGGKHGTRGNNPDKGCGVLDARRKTRSSVKLKPEKGRSRAEGVG
jgi:hypothetical protein